MDVLSNKFQHSTIEGACTIHRFFIGVCPINHFPSILYFFICITYHNQIGDMISQCHKSINTPISYFGSVSYN